MTEYIKLLRERFIISAEQKNYRQAGIDKYAPAAEWSGAGMDDTSRSAARLNFVLKAEQPKVWPDERIALIRTVPVLPEIFTESEREDISRRYYIHEQGKVCNISPDYSLMLDCGTDTVRKKISDRRKTFGADETEKNTFLDSLLSAIDDMESLADRYRKEAERVGNTTVAESFSVIPRRRPETFLQALQFLRLIHYCLWAGFNYHNTLGRFDQYMYPYFKADLDAGRIDMDTALELVEEFFISCNKDSDLYTGMQQGDNGQSIVLGGYSPDGEDQYNELSELCMTACEELRLIDPKINLRVNSTTPIERYVRSSELTKLGLGFPQYTNDDVVIPCLESWGYEREDAYNYAVAACWEIIIPGYGMDIPNIAALSFVKAIRDSMNRLPDCGCFDEFLKTVKTEIRRQAVEIIAGIDEVYMEPAPLMSLLMMDCIENCRDISHGNRYNNFGIHGTGLSTAADSLAAIKKYVFDEKLFTPEQMLQMTVCDFSGFEEEANMLRFEAPKMGNDDDEVDSLAISLLDTFADSLEGHINSRGGIYRAGTGSAMYYIRHSEDEPATSDGRRRGEAIACNYSPSLFSRCRGPVSIIKSFAKPHLERVSNGGPLTIELHDSMFRNPDSVRKVGMYVKSFMDMGGHQMQINAVNRDIIQDARIHPENHRNLIVRVWGWSGYYVELDEVYQDHILERMELTI